MKEVSKLAGELSQYIIEIVVICLFIGMCATIAIDILENRPENLKDEKPICCSLSNNDPIPTSPSTE